MQALTALEVRRGQGPARPARSPCSGTPRVGIQPSVRVAAVSACRDRGVERLATGPEARGGVFSLHLRVFS